jgi:hypothetical protein
MRKARGHNVKGKKVTMGKERVHNGKGKRNGQLCKRGQLACKFSETKNALSTFTTVYCWTVVCSVDNLSIFTQNS